MSGVEFEENNNSINAKRASYLPNAQQGPKESFFSRIFMAIGLGKSKDQAQIFMLIVALAFFAIAAIIIIF